MVQTHVGEQPCLRKPINGSYRSAARNGALRTTRHQGVFPRLAPRPLSTPVLCGADIDRDPAALSRLARAVCNAFRTPGIDSKKPRPALRDARLTSRIAASCAHTGGAVAYRLRCRETRQDASRQREDENSSFHNPLTARR